MPIFNNVEELTYERLKEEGIAKPTVVVGGFPCQDISVAGRGAGIVEGKAQTMFTFSMFDLTKPDLSFLLTVEDEIRIEIDFKATIS